MPRLQSYLSRSSQPGGSASSFGAITGLGSREECQARACFSKTTHPLRPGQESVPEEWQIGIKLNVREVRLKLTTAGTDGWLKLPVGDDASSVIITRVKC